MFIRGRLAWTVVIPATLMTGGTRLPEPGSQPSQETCAGEWRDLPPPRDSGSASLETVLRRRRSVRAFAPRPLSIEMLSQLFWAAQGVTSPRGLRTAPSAGARYPLEISAATDAGLLRYNPNGHCVRTVIPRDVRPELQRAAQGQEAVGGAGAVMVITAVAERTAGRYGARAERFVYLEAGHAAQNLLLQATALELGAVPVGAFDADQVAAALGLPAAERVVYLIPVGVPR